MQSNVRWSVPLLATLMIAASPTGDLQQASLLDGHGPGRVRQRLSPDEMGIRALFETSFVAAWTAGDANELASLWSEDGEWMSLIGSRRVVRGRTAIAAVWKVGLSGRWSPESMAIEVTVGGFRELTGDLFQVDVLMAYGSPPRQIPEAMLAIVRRVDDQWLIESVRVARLPDSSH